eukprot:357422-Chlamydomonas_euryale.AAC.5
MEGQASSRPRQSSDAVALGPVRRPVGRQGGECGRGRAGRPRWQGSVGSTALTRQVWGPGVDMDVNW